MPEIVRKNGLLLAAAVAMVALFTSMTVPAIERNRKLADLERQKIAELAELRRQARELKCQMDAFEQNDPAIQERAVRMTFQHGRPMLPVLPWHSVTMPVHKSEDVVPR